MKNLYLRKVFFKRKILLFFYCFCKRIQILFQHLLLGFTLSCLLHSLTKKNKHIIRFQKINIETNNSLSFVFCLKDYNSIQSSKWSLGRLPCLDYLMLSLDPKPVFHFHVHWQKRVLHANKVCSPQIDAATKKAKAWFYQQSFVTFKVWLY